MPQGERGHLSDEKRTAAAREEDRRAPKFDGERRSRIRIRDAPPHLRLFANLRFEHRG